MGGHSSKIAGTQFSSLAFPPKLGEKKIVGAGEKFFSQVFHLLFSIQCQTKENPLFHPIFLPIFSTIFKIHPTKHSIRERERSDRAMEAVIAAKPRIKVAALCGSLRKGSYNRGLVRSGTFPFPAFFFSLLFFFLGVGFWFCVCLVIAIELSKSINGLEIEYIDIEPLPMLNTDLEGEGTFPTAVEAFRQKIKEADSILFASPECNYSVSGTPFYTFFLFTSLGKLVWFATFQFWSTNFCHG